MTGDADVDIEVDDIDLEEAKEKADEGKDEVKEGKEELDEIAMAAALPILAKGFAALGGTTAAIMALEKYAKKKPDSVIGKVIQGLQKVGGAASAATGMTAGKTAELQEAQDVIKHLQSELNEVNLLNSKLLYQTRS